MTTRVIPRGLEGGRGMGRLDRAPPCEPFWLGAPDPTPPPQCPVLVSRCPYSTCHVLQRPRHRHPVLLGLAADWGMQG